MEIEDNYLPLCGEVGEPKVSRVGGAANASSGPHPKFARDAHEFRPPHNGGGETAERIVAIARSWIGTPYVHQASLKGAGCDCLGLLRGIWRELYGEEPEEIPPYSLDWAEATGAETLYMALKRHAREIGLERLAPGDIALFRIAPRGPAKHCGIVAAADYTSPFVGSSRSGATRVGGGVETSIVPHPIFFRSASANRPRHKGGGNLTLIHARQNKRVSEEPLSPFWRRKLAFAFRI
jgi:NlpC/P60 family putative phage cell wall peptidase